jgi:hypothetical protein
MVDPASFAAFEDNLRKLHAEARVLFKEDGWIPPDEASRRGFRPALSPCRRLIRS